MSKIIDSLEYDSHYKCYTAKSCRATNLPMYGGGPELTRGDYSKVANTLLSKTRCKEIKRPVAENEEPVAFYRVKNGYIPLFLREENNG